MPKVLTQEGNAFLIDPQTGETVEVSSDAIGEALAAGFTPASKDEARLFTEEKEYSTIGAGIAAGLTGGARALTLGLSDPLLSAAGIASPEELRLLKKYSPMASAGGEVMGTVGSLLIPGGPLGMAAKGGARLGAGAAGMAARATGRAATSAIPKLTGIAAREATIGAAMGLGTGVSEVYLSPEKMSLAEATAEITGAIGKGAALGAGLGLVGGGVGLATAKAKAKFMVDVNAVAKLKAERTRVTAELENLRTSGASAEAIEAAETRLATVSTDLSARHGEIVKRITSRALAYGIGHAIDGGITGGLLGLVVAPTALKGISKSLTPIGGKVKDVWKTIEKVAKPAANILKHTVDKPTMQPLQKIAVDAAQKAATRIVKKATSAASERIAAIPVGSTLGKIKEKVRPVIAEAIERPVKEVPDSLVEASLKGIWSKVKRKLKPAEAAAEKLAKTPLGDVVRKAKERIRPSPQVIEEVSETATAQVAERISATGGKVSWQKIKDRVKPAAKEAVKATERTAEVAKEQLATTHRGHLASEIAGHGVGTAIGTLAVAPEMAMQGLATGGLTGAAIGIGIHSVKEPLTKIADILTKKIVPGASVGAQKLLTNDYLDKWVTELADTDPQEVETALRLSMPEELPQHVASSAVAYTMSALEHMAGHAKAKDQRVPSGRETPEHEADRGRRLRSIRAVSDPQTLLESFAEQRLHKDQVTAWEKVYPRALQQLRSIARAAVEQARANGLKFTTKQAEQIATLLGDSSAAPQMYDPTAVARMQLMHRARREKKSPPPRGRALRVSEGHQTTMQRVRGG
jgi:hypothetical protein